MEQGVRRVSRVLAYVLGAFPFKGIPMALLNENYLRLLAKVRSSRVRCEQTQTISSGLGLLRGTTSIRRLFARLSAT